MNNILLIEPFYGGSHKQLIDVLKKALVEKYSAEEVHVATMKAKKWHWRARTSALHIADVIPTNISFRIVFASAVLNLAELLSLRPDLLPSKKIVYFHENQLVYPVRKYKERDFQYGYNQILTCFVADVILFNSFFNKNSFLGGIDSFFKILPDYKPKGVQKRIESKCSVLYFPVGLLSTNHVKNDSILHIVWPHRWEHDKNPEEFLQVLLDLKEMGTLFRVSVLGEEFEGVSPLFAQAKESLKECVLHWGRVPRPSYVAILQSAHVAVSTALHEFFGVSMMESAMCGCLPLCPSRLVYPELYPSACLYSSTTDLKKKLLRFSQDPSSATCISQNVNINVSSFSIETLIPQYLKLFQ